MNLCAWGLLHLRQFWRLESQLYFCRSMMSSTRKVKVGVCQMTSTPDKEKNLQQGKQLIEDCKKQDAEVMFLPEGFDCIETSKEDAVATAEPLDGPTISAYKSIASDNKVWLSLGGFKEKSTCGTKINNTHILVSPSGDIVAKYSKLHLFDVHIPGKVRLCESDYSLPGQQLTGPVTTPAGNIGLGVCYDLRFPEFSSIQRNEGADILTYPSAFTVPTGKAHWEVLLRARAIENQCYVIAAAQVGQHHAKRASYGHSMAVDPWGNILCELKEEVGVAIAEIDPEHLHHVRTSMPIIEHRRRDIYSLERVSSGNPRAPIDELSAYKFAEIDIPSSAVFHKTELSYAFVNRKPVLPGHMLISPLRVVKKLSGLTSSETADLFDVVRKVGDAVKKEFDTDSLTVSIQDGPDAGQTVEHVHVHVLPRKKEDFENNDDVYEALSTHDKTGEGNPLPANSSLWRTNEVMSEEASRMRKYFT